MKLCFSLLSNQDKSNWCELVREVLSRFKNFQVENHSIDDLLRLSLQNIQPY